MVTKKVSSAFSVTKQIVGVKPARRSAIFATVTPVSPEQAEEKNQQDTKKLWFSAKMFQKVKVFKKEESRRPSRTTRRKPERIETIEDYKSVVADEKDKIVVVRFYSPVCRSCKATEAYYHKLCQDNPDIKFVEVPTTKDNAFLHKGLGVQTFPFGHIYHPDVGLVEELKLNKKVFGDFERVFNYYVEGQGEVSYNEQGLCEPAGCRIDYDDDDDD
jgi:thiol-disulfide isomerase/thioredoxin